MNRPDLQRKSTAVLTTLGMLGAFSCSQEPDLSGIGTQEHGGVGGFLPNSFVLSCEDLEEERINNGKLHLYFSADSVPQAGANPVLTFGQNVHDLNSRSALRLDVLIYDYKAGTWYVTGENGVYYSYSSALLSQVNESDERLELANQTNDDRIVLSSIPNSRFPAFEGLDIHAGIYADGLVVVGGEGGVLYAIQTGVSASQWDSLNLDNPFLGSYDVSSLAYNHDDGQLLVAGISQHNRGQPGGAVGVISREKLYSLEARNWSTLQNPLPPNHNTHAAIYGNGRFVVVGGRIAGTDDKPSIAFSTDGTNWTRIDHNTEGHSHMNANYTLLHVVYGWEDGRFVAVGSKGKILYSTDASASTWLAVADNNNPLLSDSASADMYANGSKFIFSGITYLNGKFVAVGGYRALESHKHPSNPSGSLYGRILSSDDGATWNYLLNSPLSLIEGVGLRSIQSVADPTR